MLEEAVEAGLAACALRPRDLGLHKALARLYGEMGDFTKTAQEEGLVYELELLEQGRQ